MIFVLTWLLPRTKSSVNQGVAVNRNDNKLVVIQNKDCVDDNLSFSKNQYAIPAFLFELRQPTLQQPTYRILLVLHKLNKKINFNQLQKKKLFTITITLIFEDSIVIQSKSNFQNKHLLCT